MCDYCYFQLLQHVKVQRGLLYIHLWLTPVVCKKTGVSVDVYIALPVVNLLVWCHCGFVWFLYVLAQVHSFSCSSFALLCLGVRFSAEKPYTVYWGPRCSDAFSGLSYKERVAFLSGFPLLHPLTASVPRTGSGDRTSFLLQTEI